MARIFVFLFAFIAAASASTNFSDVMESEDLFRDSSRGYVTLVEKIKCATDEAESVAKEFELQNRWIEGEQSLVKNTNGLFTCFKYEGFSSASCMAAEVYGLGSSLRSFISVVDQENPEAGKQLRYRISHKCTTE